MYQSESAPWLEFHAWNTDGSAKTDLAYNTTGISLVVKRDNLADSSALTLSAASGPTDWASGKLHKMSGNKYRVGIATSYISSFTGKIAAGGSYTGGDLSGTTEIVSAYNPAYEPLRPVVAGRTLAVDAAGAAVLDSATQAQIDTIIDGIGWTLASLYGACANPQTTDPLVQLTINGYTYSGQYSGMNSAGVRTAPTLSKV